jgi:hypothetical protein
MHPVLRPLVRVSDGLRGGCFFFSMGCNRSGHIGSDVGGDIKFESVEGVSSGVGVCNWIATEWKGALCGRGESSISISMPSLTPGEEDATGGVVTNAGVLSRLFPVRGPGGSHLSRPGHRPVANNARRGVGGMMSGLEGMSV